MDMNFSVRRVFRRREVTPNICYDGLELLCEACVQEEGGHSEHLL
jgi:hypothetical protein